MTSGRVDAPGAQTIRRRISVGAQIIVIYCALTYVAPAIVLSQVESPVGLYRVLPDWGISLVALVAALAIYLMIGSLTLQKARLPGGDGSFRFLRTRWQVLILGFIVAAGIFGQVAGVSDFRYREASLSEGLSPSVIVFALAPKVLQFMVLVILFFERASVLRGPAIWTRNLLLIVGLALTVNGTRTVLFAFLGIIGVLFPDSLRSFIFVPVSEVARGAAQRWSRVVRLTMLLAVLTVAAPVVWIAGESIKRADSVTVLEEFADKADPITILSTFSWLASSSYVSLRIALDEYALRTDWRVIEDNFGAPFRTLAFRVKALEPGTVPPTRPEVGAIAKVNYNLISANPVNLKEGSSPGLIAGFLYCFPFPLNFIVLIAYLLVAQRVLNRLASGVVGEMSLAGKTLFLVFVIILFESPLDFLIVLDDGVVALAVLLVLAFVWIQPRTTAVRSLRNRLPTLGRTAETLQSVP